MASGRQLFASREIHRKLAFSPDGRSLVADGRIIDVATGRDLRRLAGARGSAVYSADGKTIVATFYAEQPQGAGIFDVASGKLLREIGAAGTELALSPDGKTLATSTQDGARLFEVATGKKLGDLRGHSRPVTSIAISPDGRRLATGSEDATVLVWDLSLGK